MHGTKSILTPERRKRLVYWQLPAILGGALVGLTAQACGLPLGACAGAALAWQLLLCVLLFTSRR